MSKKPRTGRQRTARRGYFERLETRDMLSGLSLVDTQGIRLIESDDPERAEEEAIAAVIGSLVPSTGGVSVVAGSERFVGRVGDGENADLAQTATFDGIVLPPAGGGGPTVRLEGPGVLLTSGTANLPAANTGPSFDHRSTGVDAPNGGASEEALALLRQISGDTLINNVNLIEFRFTVEPGTTSISAEFFFGSDEFPDQSVTDIFAFIVDGVNYARFPDGSPVSFISSTNADNFIDNNTEPRYAIEYDGFSGVLRVVGLLDESIGGGEHSLIIAIANTSDTAFDSGVFVSRLVAGNETTGGIVDEPEIILPPPLVDEPIDPPPPLDTPADDGGAAVAVADELLLLADPPTPTPDRPDDVIRSGGGRPAPAGELTQTDAPASPAVLDAAFDEAFAAYAAEVIDEAQPAEPDTRLVLAVAETDTPDTMLYVEGDEANRRERPASVAARAPQALPELEPPLIVRGQPADAGAAPGRGRWWVAGAVLASAVLWRCGRPVLSRSHPHPAEEA